jgi:malonyl-CoA O-methyltransferase
MSDSKLILPARDGYDRWSPYYDRKGNPAVSLKQREIGRLMGDVRGLSVVDLGCGSGVNSIAMAQAGAVVTGVDFSQGMLAQARRKPGAGGVRFIEHDLERPLPLETDAFDKVLCSLALEHVSALDAALAEMTRICRPDGEVVVVEMHPAMFLKGVSAHFHDPKTGRDIRPRSIVHQISDLVMAAVRAGLRIVEMNEFLDDGKHQGWPLLVTMRLRPAECQDSLV